MILPTPAAHFQWLRTSAGPALVCAPLAAVAPHLFTTSVWALGAGTSAPASGAWAAVAAALEVTEARLIRVNQVHEAAVAVARAGVAIAPDADIVVCDQPELAVAIRVADCVPLLLADRRNGTVAAAHAGWKGLAARVPEVAVAAMTREFGSRPADLVAAVGPSIGACCYEVRSDVRNRFAAAGFSASEMDGWFCTTPRVLARNPALPGLSHQPAPDRWFFDSWAAARSQLLRAGVPAGQLFVADLCTASHAGLFCSYRRDGKAAGRLAAAIRQAAPGHDAGWTAGSGATAGGV